MEAHTLTDIETALRAGKTINPSSIHQLVDYIKHQDMAGAKVASELHEAQAKIKCLEEQRQIQESKEDPVSTMEAVAACFSALNPLEMSTQARVLHATGIMLGLKPGG